jgi:hypothetical protein
MSQAILRTTFKSLALICLVAAESASLAQRQAAVSAAAPQAGASSGQASAAAALVSKQYTVNEDVKVAQTKKPLPKKGTVGVRQAQGDERIADCEATGVVCLEVLYRAGQPEIVCGWTVLFPADGSAPKVVNLNDASAQFMLRHFAADDPERPKRLAGSLPATPSLMRVAHMSGGIELRVIVEPTGKVRGTAIMDTSSPMMNNVAVDAVNGWQMETFAVNGKALPYEEVVAFRASDAPFLMTP